MKRLLILISHIQALLGCGTPNEYPEYPNNTLDMFPYYVKLTDLQLFAPD